jgi:hypothetical protein
VRISIDGHDLPGRRFVSDGVPLDNVHVALQVGRHPAEPVPGDAAAAHWDVDVRVVVDELGIDLRGPVVQGRRGDRFVYLTWGDVGADGSFAMFRRAKLMIADIEPALLAAAAAEDGSLVAEVALTDERGGPSCARLRPPAVVWRLG